MKSLIKPFLLNNMFELSTWVGFAMFIREILSFHPSTVFTILALVLIFVSDSKLKEFITLRAAPLKKSLQDW